MELLVKVKQLRIFTYLEDGPTFMGHSSRVSDGPLVSINRMSATSWRLVFGDTLNELGLTKDYAILQLLVNDNWNSFITSDWNAVYNTLKLKDEELLTQKTLNMSDFMSYLCEKELTSDSTNPHQMFPGSKILELELYEMPKPEEKSRWR